MSKLVFARALPALLVVALAAQPRLAHGDEPAAPAPASPAAGNAQDHYTAGRESYRLGLYGRALEEFARSLALAPSPNTRLYLARTLRELGRWSEAAEHYAATIREADQRGGKYVATRDAANGELADVKARLERATAGAAGAAGANAANAAGANAANGTTNAAAADGANGADDDRSAVSPSGDPAPPASARSSSSSSSPADGRPSPARSAIGSTTWISGGVTVAGAVSFAALYALSSSRYGYLEDNCARVRSAACDDARTTGKTEEIGAYISLGIAAVAAAITVYTLTTAPAPAGAAAATPRREPWRLAF